MRKKLYSLSIVFFISIFIFVIFTNSIRVNNSILFGYELFLKNIFPSLFPMFIISYILVEIGLPDFLGCLFSKVFNKLFLVKKEASFVFFMSMLTGFPSSAKYIDSLIDKNLIDIFDASKILTFTFFSNPLFIINTVGIMFFNDLKYGYIILISHILGNVFTGIIFRNYNGKVETENSNLKLSFKNLINKINTTSFFNVLLNGIRDSINTMILIFGVIVTFQVIITVLRCNLFISGLLEMSTGLKLVAISSINVYLKIGLSVFFLSFGGFCVHVQIMNILNEKRVRYLPFLVARIIHGILSVFIAVIIVMIMGG